MSTYFLHAQYFPPFSLILPYWALKLSLSLLLTRLEEVLDVRVSVLAGAERRAVLLGEDGLQVGAVEAVLVILGGETSAITTIIRQRRNA